MVRDNRASKNKHARKYHLDFELHLAAVVAPGTTMALSLKKDAPAKGIKLSICVEFPYNARNGTLAIIAEEDFGMVEMPSPREQTPATKSNEVAVENIVARAISWR